MTVHTAFALAPARLGSLQPARAFFRHSRTWRAFPPPTRVTRTTQASPRRQLLCTTRPNDGGGGTPRYIPSTRHPSLNLFSLTWRPPPQTPPVAGVLIIPSSIWHAGWFGAVGAALAGAGATTVALDGLGSGRSDALRGVRGMLHSIDDHVLELRAALLRLRDELPEGVPLFVLGESAGGVPAALLALDDVAAPLVRGYVLCAPALRVKDELLPPPVVMSAVKVVARLLPWAPVPGEKISGETWDLAFGDAHCAELSKEDPYVAYGEPIRMGGMLAYLTGMEEVQHALMEGRMRMQNVLVMHNRGDVRTDFKMSEEFVRRIGEGGKLVELGGSGHQLFQDAPEVTAKAIDTVVKFVVDTAGKS